MIVILLTIVVAGANIGFTLAILRKQVSASLGPAVAMLFARLRGSLKLYATEAKRYLWQGDTAW
jgi:hypothetical protein